MGQRLGIAYIKVDGLLLESAPGATLDIGGVTRSPVLASGAVVGYSEAPVPAVVECEISVGPGTSLVQLGKTKNATITFECDTGQTYVVREAWLVNPPKATAADGGKVPLVFNGPAAEELGV